MHLITALAGIAATIGWHIATLVTFWHRGA